MFVFPKLNFVIKIPHISFSLLYLAIRLFLKNDSRDKVRESIKNLICGGIRENKVENNFWKKNRYNFLAPTFFSFFGILNVQKYADINSLLNFVWQIRISPGDIILDFFSKEGKASGWLKHSFKNVENFGFSNGKVLILDYGEKKIISILQKYGEKAFQKINEKFSLKP